MAFVNANTDTIFNHYQKADDTDISPLPSAAQAGAARPDFLQKPVTLEATGLSRPLLLELLLKHLYSQQVATLESLVHSMRLPGTLIQALITEAKDMMWVENRAASIQARFSLSGSGKLHAEKALQYSGYSGPAPVPLASYQHSVKRQSHRNTQITRALLDTKLAGESFENEALEAMGMALNSSKPVLLYGLPGTGKSYLCRQLIKVFDDDIYQPVAVEVNNQIIQLFDPQVHELCEQPSPGTIDTRYQKIRRPLIVTGGELTLDMLEVSYDVTRHLYKAPLQMKANNGVLLLDDLGRQQVSPSALFNRWIIPLEEHKDFLSLSSGVHFEVPFELAMLFSTNLDPHELIDDAFLRRLGYKIQMRPLPQDKYTALWNRVSSNLGLECAPETFDYLLTTYHEQQAKPYLPCYPRDLLGIVKDATHFHELPPTVTPALLDDAWRHYFVTSM
ncbi:AAA family ATPase [Alteromonas sp. ASW11-19]|uniref:AAA family ATPase n=1 Tax=Alteromonas salexigens TaxID=2982530 RepID=A0ABT2VNL4_9ALTE|nr:AAA family ATPase [Alteromonas salexigens]MCU7554877.1 AAA family ATPase [Alteromonas salexigens]